MNAENSMEIDGWLRNVIAMIPLELRTEIGRDGFEDGDWYSGTAHSTKERFGVLTVNIDRNIELILASPLNFFMFNYVFTP